MWIQGRIFLSFFSGTSENTYGADPAEETDKEDAAPNAKQKMTKNMNQEISV